MIFQPVLDFLSDFSSTEVSLNSYQSVHGGCVSDAYILDTNIGRYFVKVIVKVIAKAQSKVGGDNSNSILDAEREGLMALSSVGVLKVPKIMGAVTTNEREFLILECLELTALNAIQQGQFGTLLAKHHKQSISTQFGWSENNFIGKNIQTNIWSSSWVSFFVEYRLGTQLTLLKQKGLDRNLIAVVTELMGYVPDYFLSFQPTPVLVHGDLWNGNVACVNETEHGCVPVCYDPAVYYGDREVDVAMTELFGGFSEQFYKAYSEQWPLDEGYAQRKNLYNLYHLLNHVNLFGPGYIAQANQTAISLLAQVI